MQSECSRGPRWPRRWPTGRGPRSPATQTKNPASERSSRGWRDSCIRIKRGITRCFWKNVRTVELTRCKKAALIFTECRRRCGSVAPLKHLPDRVEVRTFGSRSLSLNHPIRGTSPQGGSRLLRCCFPVFAHTEVACRPPRGYSVSSPSSPPHGETP